MKHSWLAWVSIMIAPSTLLDAQNGIQMMSQSYQVSATWQDGGRSGGDTGGYSLFSSDGSPLAVSTGSPSGRVGASASIDLFSVQQSANAFGAYDSNWNYIWGRVQQTVQADWLFSPLGNLLDVSINASYNTFFGVGLDNIGLVLTDTTDSTTLLDISPASGRAYDLTVDYTFAVKPSDTYKFSISGWGNTFPNDLSSDYLRQNIAASITSVSSLPEPSICLLLSVGFLGLFGYRSRFRN